MHAHARVVKKDATRVRKHDRIHSHQMLMRAPDAEVAAAEGSVQGKLTILQNDAESDGTWLASDILVCIVGLCETRRCCDSCGPSARSAATKVKAELQSQHHTEAIW